MTRNQQAGRGAPSIALSIRKAAFAFAALAFVALCGYHGSAFSQSSREVLSGDSSIQAKEEARAGSLLGAEEEHRQRRELHNGAGTDNLKMSARQVVDDWKPRELQPKSTKAPSAVSKSTKAPTATTKSTKAPTATKSTKAPTATKSTKAPTATKSTKAPSATKSTKAPTATKSTKAPTATKSTKAPTATKSTKAPSA